MFPCFHPRPSSRTPGIRCRLVPIRLPVPRRSPWASTEALPNSVLVVVYPSGQAKRYGFLRTMTSPGSRDQENASSRRSLVSVPEYIPDDTPPSPHRFCSCQEWYTYSIIPTFCFLNSCHPRSHAVPRLSTKRIETILLHIQVLVTPYSASWLQLNFPTIPSDS